MEVQDGMNFWIILFLVFGLLSCSENGQSSDNVLTVPESSFNDSLCQSSSSANSENKGKDDDATMQIFCGFAQKGLFEQGSKIYLLSLDAKGDLDTLEVDSTYDRYGRFSISLAVSHSANAVIAVIGKDYSMVWNNVLGGLDTLYGTPNESAKSFNVNILTHFEFLRTRELVQNQGTTFDEAKKQAFNELLRVLNMQSYADSIWAMGGFSALNIFGGNHFDGMLIASTLILDSHLETVGGIFAKTGTLPDSIRISLSENAYGMERHRLSGDVIEHSTLDYVDNTLFNWKQSFLKDTSNGSFDYYLSVAPYKVYLENFWQTGLALDKCNKECEKLVLKARNDKYYICKEEMLEGYRIVWMVASELEKNTFDAPCDSNDFYSHVGTLDSALYVCKDGVWRTATEYERKWGLCSDSAQGVIRTTENFDYVCRGKSWILKQESLTDLRDSSVYAYMRALDVYWFTENVRYKDSLYTWVASKEACPEGTHLPSENEWQTLFKLLDPELAYGFGLTKNYDFSWWWTATEESDSTAVTAQAAELRRMSPNEKRRLETYTYPYNKEKRLAVRCILD